MIPLLGLACVAWTTYEIVGLMRAPIATEPRMASAAAGDEPVRTRAHRPGKRRFSAWDDSGRSIDVEDLGIR